MRIQASILVRCAVRRIAAGLAFALWLSATLVAQPVTLVVHHNANLRTSPTTQSAIKDHLEPGDELTLETPGQTQGFYHVRTAGGVVGWVYRTLVHIEETDDIDTATFPAAAAFDPSWPKPAPVGSTLQGPPRKTCPADGEPGGDLETNRRKNRKDVPARYQAVSFDAVMALPDPNASTKRQNWTAAQRAVIEPFEGVAVSVVGYVVAVKKQSGGSGEATNCHFNTTNFVDTHVALVTNIGDGEKEAIVVEPTPRFYGANASWLYAKLRDLDDSSDPVRISGWTLFDPVHKGHLGKYRATLWEIHPVTKIEVFRNGRWHVW